MNFHLSVVVDFGNYVKGQMITDVDAIKAALETHSNHVVKVATTDAHTKFIAPDPAVVASNAPAV